MGWRGRPETMKLLLGIIGVAVDMEALVTLELLVPGDDDVMEYSSSSESE